MALTCTRVPCADPWNEFKTKKEKRAQQQVHAAPGRLGLAGFRSGPLAGALHEAPALLLQCAARRMRAPGPQ